MDEKLNEIQSKTSYQWLKQARNTHSSQTTQQSSTLSDAEKAKMLQEVEAQQADFGLQK